MDVHGNALTSPFTNAALNGEVKQMLSFLTNLITKPASRPHDTAHGPTAGVPDVPGPGWKVQKNIGKQKQPRNESRNIWNGNSGKLWKVMETHEKRPNTMKIRRIPMNTLKIEQNTKTENTRTTDRNYETLWKAMKNNEKHRKWKTSFKKHWKHMKSSERLRQAMKTP